MNHFKRHLIGQYTSVQEAMKKIDVLASDGILFIVDENDVLLGSITDGDIRRGFIEGLTLDNTVKDFMEKSPKYIDKYDQDFKKIIQYRDKDFKILPVLNTNNQIVDLVNFRILKSYLPIDTVIMAGGRGQRLSPLTDSTPKPLLKVGNKPIIEHNIDRLTSYGIKNFWISVKYLGEQIENYLGKGENKNINVQYIWEEEPLGTIGAVSKIDVFTHEYVLITNSDLLTAIDYEDFFCDLLASGADMMIATVPYSVNIPYAVLETENNLVLNFKEKPNYVYYANAGIYLVKREVLKLIPKDSFYNATDLIERCIQNGYKVNSYALHEYWLDIGKMDDFEKAQEDVKHIKL